MVAAKAASRGLGNGASDDVAKAAATFSKERGAAVSASDYQAYRDGLNVYMRRGGNTPANVMAAMSVGSDPDGGYSVTPDTTESDRSSASYLDPLAHCGIWSHRVVIIAAPTVLEGFNTSANTEAGWCCKPLPRPAFRTLTRQVG